MRRELRNIADAAESAIAKVRELSGQIADPKPAPHTHTLASVVDEDGILSTVATGTTWHTQE